MKKLLLPFLIFLFAICKSAKATEIEVFFNDKHRIYKGNYEVTEHNLDDKLRIEDALSKGLPSDPEKAMVAARQIFNTPEFQEKINKLKKSSFSYISAFNYQLSKIPAIVIDKKYILYGLTDVDRAMEIYYEYTGS